jgi:predicted ATPase
VYISHLALRNWRNFREVDVDLQPRTFVVGPNASGKSNLLDAFRFLQDLAQEGGGLQKAIKDRNGITSIRCLAARKYPEIEINVRLAEPDGTPAWRYALAVKGGKGGENVPHIVHERVWRGEKQILQRPDSDDNKDTARLTQTQLEQVSANKDFRDIAKHFADIDYLHLVPQLVRHPREFAGPGMPGDPFGHKFLERMAKVNEKTRKSWLATIEKALRVAVPQLKELQYEIDNKAGGVPHLRALYEHWRPHGARQTEQEFSDGTLRLIGLLWSLLEGKGMLLLEEPELSLNAAIVEQLPELIERMRRRAGRQILVSTHSYDMLANRGIAGEEVLLLIPQSEGTAVRVAASDQAIYSLLKTGISVGDAVMPYAKPDGISQLSLFP